MLRSGILPDSKNYNLLLRTARDCGIGDPALATGVLLRPDRQYERERVSHVKSESGRKDLIDIDFLERQLFLQPDPLGDSQQDSRSSEEESYSRQDSTQLVPVRQRETASLPVDLAADSTAPNLLDLFEGKRGGVVSLGTVDGASDRLALIGGAKGFLEKMAAKGLSPDLRTLTLLADTMEPGYQSLQMLLRVAKQHKVKLDRAFFNTVIRRAARAGDLEEAKVHTLSLSNKPQLHSVHPNENQIFSYVPLVVSSHADSFGCILPGFCLHPNIWIFIPTCGGN